MTIKEKKRQHTRNQFSENAGFGSSNFLRLFSHYLCKNTKNNYRKEISLLFSTKIIKYFFYLRQRLQD